MNFIVYDLTLLVLFVVFVSIFLYTKRENLKKEGLLFLYRANWGVKLIDYVGNKYKRTLKFLSYVSVGLGYVLMAGVLWMTYTLVKVYATRPDVVTAVKVPPIMPLVPYIDKLVPFLPSFFFTYWIVILAIIAITHEFAHGIFAAYHKVKTKKTGFGFFPFFLPIFLAAFVELDEEVMAKKEKFKQMAILSAGTFANLITAILSFAIMWLFFMVAFVPSGIAFDTYAYSAVGIGGITSVGGVALDNPSLNEVIELMDEEDLTKIVAGEEEFVSTKTFVQNQLHNEEFGRIVLYDDAPAINAGIRGAIYEIGGTKIDSREGLSQVIGSYSEGDSATIKTKTKDESFVYEITLGKHPTKEDAPWLGIGFTNKQGKGLMSWLNEKVSSFKEPNVYYEPKSDLCEFIYNLLWWLVLISISVALVNMLPVGIFDGGRFFYLTVLGITKSKKVAKRAFSVVTYFFLFILLVLMYYWVRSFL